MSRHGYFISDLHLFSRRSQAALYMEDIWRVAGDAHTFALGGDIFDFKWSTLPSVEQTVAAAIGWLEELVTAHPDCQFQFILGNHDSAEAFVRQLEELAGRAPNLAWHRYYWRQGDCLFLHGDVADGAMNPEQLSRRRARFARHDPRGAAANLLYDAAVQARLHVLAAQLVHPPHRVLRRIMAYLQHIGQGPESGLRHVYFGHTHCEMSDVAYHGLRFHNGGAPLKAMRFRIVRTQVQLGQDDE